MPKAKLHSPTPSIIKLAVAAAYSSEIQKQIMCKLYKFGYIYIYIRIKLSY